jgi:glucose/mannose transport system permease protein
MSISFVATGLIWRWILEPRSGVQQLIRSVGWSHFHFDWLVRPDKAIYTLALAAIWQQTGLCLALFLAGLRQIDPNIYNVARIDAIPSWRVQLDIVAPALRPVFITGAVVLLSMAAKSYDLVVTLTGGGPGFSSDLPGHYVVELVNRGELGMGAAGSCILMCTIAGIVAPYLYWELRRRQAR